MAGDPLRTAPAGKGSAVPPPGSGGALAIGVGDRVLMLENAWYSVISPEMCAQILWKDPARAPEAAAALRISPAELRKLGIVDEVVPEPLGGAHRDREETARRVREALLRHLEELRGIPADELVARRIERYRALGGAAQRAEEVLRRLQRAQT